MKTRRLTKGSAGRWAPVALAVLMMMSALATAEAQRPGHGRGGCAQVADQASEAPAAPGERGDWFCRRLDLTDDQRKAVDALCEEHRAQQVESQKELLRARHALRGALLEDEPALGTVRELVRKVGELETQREIARVEHRLAVRKLLTPEQRDRLLLMEQRRGHQRGHPGRAGCGARGHGGRQMECGPGHCDPRGRKMGCGHGQSAPGAPCAPAAPGCGRGMGRGFQGLWFAPDAPDGDDAPAGETVEYGLLWDEPPLDE